MISRVRGCKPHRVGANLLFGIHFAGKYMKMKRKKTGEGAHVPHAPRSATEYMAAHYLFSGIMFYYHIIQQEGSKRRRDS